MPVSGERKCMHEINFRPLNLAHRAATNQGGSGDSTKFCQERRSCLLQQWRKFAAFNLALLLFPAAAEVAGESCKQRKVKMQIGSFLNGSILYGRADKKVLEERRKRRGGGSKSSSKKCILRGQAPLDCHLPCLNFLKTEEVGSPSSFLPATIANPPPSLSAHRGQRSELK